MKKQIKSFRYATEGFISAVKSEGHLRFHLVAAFYVFLFAYLGDFTLEEYAILTVTVAGVIFSELINTAIEELCDLYSTHWDKRIKRIKDISAAAVLVLSIGATIVALWLFLLTGNLWLGIEKLIAKPLWFIPLGISAVLSVLFIIFTGRKNKKSKTESKE